MFRDLLLVTSYSLLFTISRLRGQDLSGNQRKN